MRVFAGNVGIRLRTALFAVLLAVPPLVAGAPAPAANAGIAGPIQPFPWDSRPKGWIAFGSEGGTDARGQPITGGLFAATRECSSLDCTYRLTDNPADHDPAWDPTGQFVWFATQACRNDGLCTSTIGSVDTATGAVSRFDPFAIDVFTGNAGVATW